VSRILKVAIASALLFAGMVHAQNRPDGPGTGQQPGGADRGARPGRPQGRHRPSPNPHPQPGRPTRPSPPRPNPPAHRPPPPQFRPPSWGHRPPHSYLSEGRWRRSVRAPHFRYPPGFAYRRWVTGAILPSIFLSTAFFYDDFAPLGLEPPPPGYRWVRYGPDLLLVNATTGRVADVVDGTFY
jgi:Ni/Co efflux regulator RcnB